MGKFLLAYDGSESAERALQHVISVASQQPTSIVHVLTVEDEPRIYGEIAVYVQKKTIERALIAAGTATAAAATARLAAAGVAHQSEVLIGDPAQTIAQRADAQGCTQIVMGTRGMSGIANLFLGSVATKVLHGTHLPVTLVR